MPDEVKPGAENESPPEESRQAPSSRKKGRVTDPRKESVVGRAVDAVTGPLSALRLPPLDWKLVSYGLLLLIGVILVARNWAPVRINIFGWYLDMPKALAFVLFFVLGGLTTWILSRRGKRHRRVQVTAPVVKLVAPDEEAVEDESETPVEDETPDDVETDEGDEA